MVGTSSITGNTAGGEDVYGIGVDVESGAVLTLADSSSVSDNSSTSGASSIFGGGIFNDGSVGLTDCGSITGNNVSGIDDDSGTGTLNDSAGICNNGTNIIP